MRPLALLMAFFALASSPAVAAEEVYVELDPGRYQAESFPQNRNIKFGSLARPAELDPEVRDGIFARVEGLEEALEGFDELERDLLLIRARKGDPARLHQTHYPFIPLKILRHLVEECRK